jgi:hypothetical protein
MILGGVFVPALSAGHLVVGVTISQNAFSKNSLCKPPQCFDPAQGFGEKLGSVPKADGPIGSYSLCTGRYARDTRNGSILVITHESLAPGSAAHFCISYFRLLSSTRVKQTELICMEQLFQSGRILESIVFCSTGKKARFCPSCGAAPNAG